MPTFVSHPAIPVTLAVALGTDRIPPRLAVAGAIASLLPDLDVIGLRAGVPYAAPFGHRGASHSLAAAAALALVGAALHRPLRARAGTVFLFLLAAAASHGLLDALTNGGLGVALLWPLSDARIFAPVRPIQVAPLRHVIGARGLAAIGSELVRVWAPCAVVALALAARRVAARRAGT